MWHEYSYTIYGRASGVSPPPHPPWHGLLQARTAGALEKFIEPVLRDPGSFQTLGIFQGD